MKSVYSICSATGHVLLHPRGQFCPDHGAKLFTHCSSCEGEWPRRKDVPALDRDDQARDFCDICSAPAPWLNRRQRIDWLKGRLADADLEPAKRLELQEVLDHIAQLAADDTKAIAGWQRLRNLAPTVWEKAQPIINTVIAEALKKALGL